MVKQSKSEYYKNRLTSNKKANDNINTKASNVNNNENSNNFKIKPEISNNNKMWNTVKEITNNNKKQPPRVISYKNEIVTSIKKIADIYNDHFITKINTIRSKSYPGLTDHSRILDMIFTRNDKTLIIPKITLEGTKNLIRK